MSPRYPSRFNKGETNPIRALIHGWTHRRTGTQLICDATILALGAIVLDFVVLFASLIVDSFAMESEPPALITGLGMIFVRTLMVGAVVVGGIGFARFAKEGTDTMSLPRRNSIDANRSLPSPETASERRDAA